MTETLSTRCFHAVWSFKPISNLIIMNVASAKVENTTADESDQSRPDPSASQPVTFPQLTEKVSSNEDTDRRLYRRSVAYFFFGFGSNKNTILTDEP